MMNHRPILKELNFLFSLTYFLMSSIFEGLSFLATVSEETLVKVQLYHETCYDYHHHYYCVGSS